MMSTLEERMIMIDKSEKAGYHISYTMCIMEEMIQFSKTTKGKSISEKLALLDKNRWLGTSLFKTNSCHLRWLEL